MQIRKVDRFTFDVFGDVGFDNWSRIRKYHWGYKVVNGVHLGRELMRDITTKLDAYPRGAIENV